MAKKSYNEIRSMDEDWMLDSRNNLPYSGQSVQQFIKSKLKRAAGAAWFNQANFTLYFFATEEDRDTFAKDTKRTDLVLSSTPMNFSADMYRIQAETATKSIQAATNQTSVPIVLNWEVQTKKITETVWSATSDDVYVKLYIDVGANGAWSEIPLQSTALTAGTPFVFNARQYLVAGANRVKVELRSKNDENVMSSTTWNITLSEMYIEELSNTWYNALVEGEASNYKLGGFRIVGALQKTLHIEIYQGDSMVLSFENLIGLSSYTDVPYYFTADAGLDLSSLPTGIYICKAYLTSGSLTSLPISFNFMYVTEEDRSTAQLVCANEVAEKAFNYSTVALCQYAIYNRGLSTGDPNIKIQLWSGTTPEEASDALAPGTTVGEPHSLEYTIEWLTEATINLFVYFELRLGSSSQVQSIPIDNSAIYPAAKDADFYLNATSRANTNTNRESILNEAPKPAQEIPAQWKRMSWVDGIDGWTTDDEGRKCLLIPAGSECSIPYRVMSGSNITIELCYKIKNTSNYNENIITAAKDPLSAGFQGLRIRPDSFTLHSGNDRDDSNDTNRGKLLPDEKTIHLLLVIQNNYGGHNGCNLVTAYVNGCKALQFDYASGTAWENTENLIIGSSSADAYIYFCRVYKRALGVRDAEQNYINSLRTLEERATASAWFNGVVTQASHEITYEDVVNAPEGYNFFVIEMKNGASIPSRVNGWEKKSKGVADWEMHFGKHPSWDWKVYDMETTGQGTTSQDYDRWNLRGRADKSNDEKKVAVSYYDEPSVSLDNKKVFNPRPAVKSKTFFFDGGGVSASEQQHPAVIRVTAKTNTASSMQSHKIGATRAYNDLQQRLGINNEAQLYAKENGLPVPTTAVYQYPAFGFSRTVSAQGVESYEFIGLFTIGPDKGDKPTFGFNINDEIKSELITLEGTDHSRLLALFQSPWDSTVKYLAENECLNIVINSRDFDNGWEVSNCHGLSTDSAQDQEKIQAILEKEFKPAYEVAWKNSTLITGIPLGTYGENAEETLAAINASLTANEGKDSFRNLRYDERLSMSDMQFWIEGEYTLYHYDLVTKQYIPDINLMEQLGTPEGETLTEQNEWFKARRREHFKEEALACWDMQDSIFHLCFLLIMGSTDNFAKNSYPYKMKGLWKWRQDDLDTFLDTDNQGADTKPYYIEFKDSVNGSVYFAGSTSVFWNLIFETFYEDYGTSMGIASMGKAIVEAMAALGSSGGSTYNGVMNFFKKYFWDNAQNYFPPSAYNEDANWKYENAWLRRKQGAATAQAVDPLKQSMGNHYESEWLWCSRRAIYVMSLFRCGPFGSYSDATMGQIAFRPQSLGKIALTPAMKLYPALANGAGSPAATARTEAGEAHEFIGPFGTDGQTTFYIQAANYLQDVGDWKDLQLSETFDKDLSIVGSKLRQFKIGDEDPEAVSTNVAGLKWTNTACLEEIDARNAASLTGNMDLSACRRLRRAWFEGTKVPEVTLPNGSKIESLHLSDDTTKISLKNLKFLTDFVMPEDKSSIRNFHIERCANLNPIGMLKGVFDSEDADLQYIRIIWDDVQDVDADYVDMLAKIADGQKKDGTEVEYRGITAQDEIMGPPVIEGDMQLTAGLYMDNLEKLGITSIEDYRDNLKRALCSAFGTLNVIYDPGKLYIRFADSEVARLAIANWGDGQGVTTQKAAAVTNIKTIFKNNANITSFDELQYFTGLTYIYGTGVASNSSSDGAFWGNKNLERVVLPETVKSIQNFAFAACTSLRTINLPESITSISIGAFQGDTALEIDVNLPNLTSLGAAVFSNSGIKSVSNLGKITSMTAISYNYGYFSGCKKLKSVVLPDTLTGIGQYCFDGCTALETINLPESLTKISDDAFRNCTSLHSINVNSPINFAKYSFYGCKNLEIIGLEKVTYLGTYSLWDCSAIAGEYDFENLTGTDYNCITGTKITKIIFRKNVTFVTTGGNAGIHYSNSNYTLKYVEISSLQTNPLSSYLFYNCRALEIVVIKATTPPTMSSTNIFSATNLKAIYVPDESVEDYRAATNWSSFASIIQPLSVYLGGG